MSKFEQKKETLLEEQIPTTKKEKIVESSKQDKEYNEVIPEEYY